jgi:glycosyltransferase involved in cell wall biosynthesis
MRVLFDHQIMDAQVRGGASRYFHQLASTLKDRDLAEIQLPRVYTDNEYFQPLLAELGSSRAGVRSRLVQEVRKLPASKASREIERAWRRTKSRLNRRASVAELEKQDFDLFHPTYYDPYFLDHLQGKPFVLTIHDMIHEIYPEYFRAGDRTSEHKKLLARAATKIIAVSASTKADIVERLGIDPAKIEVIYLASPLTGECERVVAIPQRYVLYVGARGRYKNFKKLILAFARLASAMPDLYLVCAGQKGFDPAELELIWHTGLDGRCSSLSVSDRQLTFLYRNAALFAYPSLYEGFGLPVLEAFACGCPVALSDASCFPEIAGDAALYFDPTDTLSIASVLERLLLDGAERQRLVRRGQERLKKFSWAATAEQTASLYRECLAEN